VRSKHENALPLIVTHGWPGSIIEQYTKFVAQGGDWGAVVVDQMGVHAPSELLGIHTNMPGIFPADIDKAALSGAPAPSGLSPDEKVAYERLQFVYQKGIAYGFQMGLQRYLVPVSIGRFGANSDILMPKASPYRLR